MSQAYGIARTTELTLFPTRDVPAKAATVAMAQSAARRPLLAATPDYLRGADVFGVWSVVDRSTPLKRAVEDRLDSVLAYYRQQVDERRWYGFWYYGDFIHSYSAAAHNWYYDWGGHAWDNTELAAPIWLWQSFVRTGRADVFHLAEAHARNTSETNVYHLGPMAGARLAPQRRQMGRRRQGGPREPGGALAAVLLFHHRRAHRRHHARTAQVRPRRDHARPDAPRATRPPARPEVTPGASVSARIGLPSPATG